MKERIDRLNELLQMQQADFTVEYMTMVKNAEKLDVIALGNDRMNAKTIIYPDKYFWSIDDQERVDILVDIFKEHARDFVVSGFMNRGYILANVYPKLVSAEAKNRIGDDDVCYEEYLDMLIEFIVTVPSYEDGVTAGFTLHHRHIQSADLTVEELYRHAIKNMRNEGMIVSLDKILVGEYKDFRFQSGMFIMSNRSKFYGAGTILVPELLDALSDILGDPFIILPSSVHEIIAMPTGLITDLNVIASWVREINEAKVAPEDRLTNSVYICDGGYISMYQG